MPGQLVHVGAQVLCQHGGQATPLIPAFRVKVSGMMVAWQASPHIIAGCAMPPPPAGNGPCVIAIWQTAALRVKSMGIPVLLKDSKATCLITGTPVNIVATQMRVKGI